MSLPTKKLPSAIAFFRLQLLTFAINATASPELRLWTAYRGWVALEPAKAEHRARQSVSRLLISSKDSTQ